MGLLSMIQTAYNKIFRPEAERKFDQELQLSATMETMIERYYAITSGHPAWADPKDDIETLNFAGYIDDVTAGLVTLGLSVTTGDTVRGKELQKTADYVLAVLLDKVSEGLGNAGIMFKPNGDTVDYYEAGSFAPTSCDSNGNIIGCVFQTKIIRDKFIYTRLEYHRFEDGLYVITNYAYKKRSTAAGTGTADIGIPCELTEISEWANIEPEVYISGIDKPLFSYFGNPAPNRVDRSSCLSVPIWAYCLKELKDLDIAWSRKAGEIEDSKHITFVSASAISGAKNQNLPRERMVLPRYVRGLEMGIGDDGAIHEHVPTVLTSDRISDINSILAMISTKCGFSQGFFQLDEKSGVMTATQVEADDQGTIRTIKNIRDALKASITNLLYAQNVMLDLYGDSTPESWNTLKDNITFDFDDITYNYEEDRANWWKYRIQGDVPAWKYYVMFEGMTEENARAMVEEATPKTRGLFDDEG